jgi:hypothetical protein
LEPGVIEMSGFQGWKKIYLFYGVVFFLLGGMGVCLNTATGLSGFVVGLRRLAADLHSYTDVIPGETGQTVAVGAAPSTATITFYYPKSWAENSTTPLLQLHKILTERFSRVEMKPVNRNIDFAAWLAAITVKDPGRVIAGLELPKTFERCAATHLWLRTLTAPPLDRLTPNLSFLPDGAQITVKLRQRQLGCIWEISWEEPGQPGANWEPVIALWREIIRWQGLICRERQPVLQ